MKKQVESLGNVRKYVRVHPLQLCVDKERQDLGRNLDIEEDGRENEERDEAEEGDEDK